MILTIDNFDGAGARDYTFALDAERAPRVHRRLNRPSELRAWLLSETANFVVPVAGGRVILARANGLKIFTGYVAAPPAYEYLGWGERGPVYRYVLLASSDEFLLDRKPLPRRAAFVNRTAGAMLKQMAADLAPPAFDAAGLQDVATLPFYSAGPQKPWSHHAAQIALRARAACRVHDGALRLAPIGSVEHVLDESAAGFSPDALQLSSSPPWANDLTVFGAVEPQAYVKDYFLGDGTTLRFFLSESPFTRRSFVLVDEEYKDAVLRPEVWTRVDPAAAVSVSGGKLRVEGGTGADGGTLVTFAEPLELGGALLLQHGDVSFSAASDGIIGGLYNRAVSQAACVAGFRITPSGFESQISAFINGAPTGSPVTTVAGRRYVLTTRAYARENYRRGQTFHSSAHPAGGGRGGAALACDVRLVLELREIDPNNPASLVAPSTVLYDGVLANAPDDCTYALINAASAHCSLAFTRLARAVDAEVRTALPNSTYRTRLVGSLVEGAECRITQDSQLWFFSACVPAANEKIVVSYRSRGRAQARLRDDSSIAAEAHGQDNGVRSAVRHIAAPAARTSEDCENAALAVLDDSTQVAWSGEYRTWSDFLPAGSADVFPGDTFTVHAPSRGAHFSATVREVEIETAALAGDHAQYRIVFANDAAEPLALSLQPSDNAAVPDAIATDQLPPLPPSLSAAEITAITSTDVTVDTFADPPAGGGFEVRRSDAGWGPDNDRNLIGRFTTRVFTLARLFRVQSYYIRAFDASAPPRYSRHSVLLHVDYP